MSTQTPIASITLNAATSSVTFANIPQTYTDLVVVTNFAMTANDQYAHYVQVNGDTGGNYSRTILYGDGSSAGSARQSDNSSFYFGTWNTDMDTTDRAVTNIFFNNYSNTTTFKTAIGRYNVASKEVGVGVGTWRNTAAITSINLATNSTTYIAGSTFNLYGIDAELSAQAKAYGGDTIVTDGSYWYHTFLSSGTFTPTSTLSADVLVVAGGGGGGNYGGGGGGGGYSEQTGRSCTTNTNYTVTIGAGGAGATRYNTNGNIWLRGSNGSNSVFDTITSNGGGGGGAASTVNTGAAGGSGGGGGAANGAGGAANQGNSGGATGYGFAGGNGLTDNVTYTNSGGGGGAGAVGSNATSSSAGNGGNGRASSISGASVTYAGGGGGGTDQNSKGRGTGGTGGGGDGAQGASGSAGSNGTNNLGGGGGGGGSDSLNAGYNGGSGIVIIRYAV